MSLWMYEQQDKDLIRFGLSFTKELCFKQSKFQEIRVVDTHVYGKMLVLDGCVMTTDHDEFIYHEMIAHIPACFHPNPKNVVVIGGGDGGTVRELLKYKNIEKITLCEIDEDVINVSKEFLPDISSGFNDPRVEVRIGDGVAYIKTLQNEADIIIIDSTDPFGPGEGLFSGEFYRNVAKALKSDGIMIAQSESPWIQGETLRKIYSNMKEGFETVKPYVAPIPTYPRGLWSWSLGTNAKSLNFNHERFAQVAPSLQFLTQTKMETLFDIPPFYAKKLQLN